MFIIEKLIITYVTEITLPSTIATINSLNFYGSCYLSLFTLSVMSNKALTS